MPGQLVEQLVEAGLITEAQARASDAGDPLVSTSRVIQRLVDRGLDERTLAGFFVAKGFGPMLQAPELARADAELVRQIPAADAHDLVITTVEGIGSGGELHPLQQAFVDHGGVQCGFCTPGFIVAGAHLLEQNPRPSSGEIREALSGNLCRCTGYGGIERAILSVTEGQEA